MSPAVRPAAGALVVVVSGLVAACSGSRADDGPRPAPAPAPAYDALVFDACDDLLRGAELRVLSGSDWQPFMDAADDDRAECGYQTTREPTEERPDFAVTVLVTVEADEAGAQQEFDGLVATAAAGTGFGAVPEMVEVPGWWRDGRRFESVLLADSLITGHPGRAGPELQLVVVDENVMATVRVTSGPARRPAHAVVAQLRAIGQAVVDRLPDLIRPD